MKEEERYLRDVELDGGLIRGAEDLGGSLALPGDVKILVDAHVVLHGLHLTEAEFSVDDVHFPTL